MEFLDVISWTEQWILAKHNKFFHYDSIKSWLDFGDLDLIFNVTILKTEKSAISALYLLNQWVNLNQTCRYI